MNEPNDPLPYEMPLYWTPERKRYELRQGPWQSEPDRSTWTDEASGYPCVVNRSQNGCFNGYVGIPKGHALHGAGYSDEVPVAPYVNQRNVSIDEDIGVLNLFISALGDAPKPEVSSVFNAIRSHGGLTYASPSQLNEFHWFGFDCAHASDINPSRKMGFHGANAVYREFHYVVDSAMKMAEDLLRYQQTAFVEVTAKGITRSLRRGSRYAVMAHQIISENDDIWQIATDPAPITLDVKKET